MQWHLARLPNRAAKNQQTYAGRNCHANACSLCDKPEERRVLETSSATVVKEQRAGLRIEPNHAQQEGKVANSRGKECLLRCRCRTRLVIPEADEQVGCQADDLPADKE